MKSQFSSETPFVANYRMQIGYQKAMGDVRACGRKPKQYISTVYFGDAVVTSGYSIVAIRLSLAVVYPSPTTTTSLGTGSLSQPYSRHCACGSVRGVRMPLNTTTKLGREWLTAATTCVTDNGGRASRCCPARCSICRFLPARINLKIFKNRAQHSCKRRYRTATLIYTCVNGVARRTCSTEKCQ